MKLEYLNLANKNFSGTIQNCLALAISDVLWNSSNEGETDIVMCVPQSNVTNRNQPVLPHQCTKITLSLQQNSNAFPLIYNFVKMYLGLFSQADSQGVILLVYSVIMTRTVDNIRQDMDLEDSTLLN